MVGGSNCQYQVDCVQATEEEAYQGSLDHLVKQLMQKVQIQTRTLEINR